MSQRCNKKSIGRIGSVQEGKDPHKEEGNQSQEKGVGQFGLEVKASSTNVIRKHPMIPFSNLWI